MPVLKRREESQGATSHRGRLRAARPRRRPHGAADRRHVVSQRYRVNKTKTVHSRPNLRSLERTNVTRVYLDVDIDARKVRALGRREEKRHFYVQCRTPSWCLAHSRRKRGSDVRSRRLSTLRREEGLPLPRRRETSIKNT